MSTFAETNILDLSVSERIQLVEEIWDSIARTPEEVPLTPEQKTELDHRMECYRQNREEGAPWEEVKKRIRAGK